MSDFLTFVQEQEEGTSTMSVVYSIASIVGMWKMFQKAGQEGWPAIVPLYNLYKLCEISMGDGWYCLRLLTIFIPFVGIIPFLYFMFQIYKATARAYGQPESWAWGYLLLSPVFYCLTGFGAAGYYGPNGEGDTRTREARGARTVDYDVIRNDVTPVEPVQGDFNASAQDSVAAAADHSGYQEDPDTVNFTFDEPVE